MAGGVGDAQVSQGWAAREGFMLDLPEFRTLGGEDWTVGQTQMQPPPPPPTSSRPLTQMAAGAPPPPPKASGWAAACATPGLMERGAALAALRLARPSSGGAAPGQIQGGRSSGGNRVATEAVGLSEGVQVARRQAQVVEPYWEPPQDGPEPPLGPPPEVGGGSAGGPTGGPVGALPFAAAPTTVPPPVPLPRVALAPAGLLPTSGGGEASMYWARHGSGGGWQQTSASGWGVSAAAVPGSNGYGLMEDAFGSSTDMLSCTGLCGKAWLRWEDVPYWSKSRRRKPWCLECGNDRPGPWNNWVPQKW